FGYEIDVLWFGWSKVDKLDLVFDSLGTSTVNLNYSDRFQIRAGVHYDVNEKLTLRGGYIYDPTPQPMETMGPLLPDADRHDFSVGLGYKFGKARIDLGYMMVNWNTRSTVEDGVGKNENNFNGTYDTRANLFFLSFGYGSL
ncbi:MAG: OmpP1/FadL family transporter, partial [Calditrichia bacterium]